MINVLVIDDCDEFRETVCMMLEGSEYNPLQADCPEAAFSVCEQEMVDIVLCDMVMPLETEYTVDDDDDDGSAMVGLNTMQKLKKLHPNVVIVAISGEMKGESLKGLSAFGNFYTLEKPFGREKLLGLLDSFSS